MSENIRKRPFCLVLKTQRVNGVIVLPNKVERKTCTKVVTVVLGRSIQVTAVSMPALALYFLGIGSIPSK